MAVIYELVNRDAVLAALEVAGAPPAFANVVADHVTYLDGDRDDGDGGAPPPVGHVGIVGYACGEGVDALVVDLDGALRRPDGKVFHLTLSLADGHEAGEAGGVAAAALEHGSIVPLSGIALELRPAR